MDKFVVKASSLKEIDSMHGFTPAAPFLPRSEPPPPGTRQKRPRSETAREKRASALIDPLKVKRANQRVATTSLHMLSFVQGVHRRFPIVSSCGVRGMLCV